MVPGILRFTKRNDKGELGFAVYVGGGQGRTPMVAKKIRDFLPVADLLAYHLRDLRSVMSEFAFALDASALAAPDIDTQRAIDLLWQLESLPSIAPLIGVLVRGTGT